MVNVIEKFNDLVSAGKEELAAQSTDLTDTSDGSVIDVLLHAGAAIGFEVYNLSLSTFRKVFFATAEGSDLDNLAYDRFRLTRQSAVRSVGQITLSRLNTSAGNVSIPAYSVFTTDADNEGNVYRFRTTAPSLMTGLSLTATVEAVEAGSSGNISVGEIVNVETALTDSSITVTNSAAMSGGTDAETDDDFRQRIVDYFINLRRGTVAALEYGARSIAGINFATVSEDNIASGIVDVYVGDVNNTANNTLLVAVANELENWRAAGIAVSVHAVSTTATSVDLTMTYESGADQTSIQEDIISAITTYANTLEIGETLYLSQLYKIVAATDGVVDVEITSPASNVTPSTGYRITIAEEDIAFS